MTSSRIFVAIAVALVIAAATWLLGWWAAIPVGAVVGWLQRTRGGRAGSAGIGAALGWALLLAIDYRGERFPVIAEQVQSVLRLPWPALMAGSLVLPAALAWGAAALVASLAAPAGPAGSAPRENDPFAP